MRNTWGGDDCQGSSNLGTESLEETPLALLIGLIITKIPLLIYLLYLDDRFQGAPYAYTPFCDNNKEMDEFRFWKGGFWKDHLRVSFFSGHRFE